MANYDSAYTGQEVDEAVTIARAFGHTPVEIDAAVTKIEDIESTPSDIDTTVRGFAEYPLPSAIDAAISFVNDLTVDASEVNAAVLRIEDLDSSMEDVDDAVDTIVNNNATNGQLLTADGGGGCVWRNAPNTPSLYRHTATFTKVEGGFVSRIAIQWYDASNATSINQNNIYTALGAWYRNPDCPLIVQGEVYDSGISMQIDGLYFAGGDWVFVSDEQQLTTYSLENLNGWTFGQVTVQIF